MIINCLIIDDEPSAQSVIKHFISDVSFLKLKGVCNSALEAIDVLNDNKEIDLIFLDINMPKLSGLSFYKSLQNPPNVIFTTAYSDYALEGFEVNAIDYLLKPFSFERFLTAVNKLKTAIKHEKSNQTESLIIKANKVLHKVNTKDIIYIEAFGDYIKVHLRDEFILTNSTFKNMLNQLPNELFVQIHKSFSINLNYLEIIKGNTAQVQKKSLPIGQSYKAKLLERLKE
ncbi:LytTR family DNA-binding domain-containing protein [Ichthyenterobacterium sp. W332]|uniref:LytTR family DNA-binding domain-containing protein n=1 Tax=Microcosmobacter mediterraneus TaxID=3075607 RepID=A0ABU2YH14_9FLAO|nr:LytTR family DNA-binding domain-containing protein [Ichthyenterobacterium sp. W332]MDT0557464.1 LytTR family DNA-binding domain-containing protein [Ichthyenterobacterium sp. W332]